MKWSRRRVLAGLGATPLAACARLRDERTPPMVPSTSQVSYPVIHPSEREAGPRLTLVEDHGLPLVSMAIAIRAGHHHEPSEHPGLAAVAASMLLEGMAGGTRTEQMALYGDLGTTPATSTMGSLLVLGCTVHRDEVGPALRLMARTLRAPTMAAEAFARTLREHRQWAALARGEPALVAGLGLLTASLGVEPPSPTLGIGTPLSLDGLALETVASFLDTHVRREEATILMAGDVDEQTAWPLVEDALADWPSTVSTSSPPSPEESDPFALDSTTEPEPEPPPSPEPPSPTTEPAPEPSPSRGARAVLVPWPSLPQAFIAVGGPRAPYGDEDEPGQSVATSLLASTLQYELRTRQRSTYAVQSRVWQTRLGNVHQMWVRVDPDRAHHAVAAVREQLAELSGDRQFSEQIVAEVRRSKELDSMLGFHGPEATLGELLRLADAGLPADTPRRRLEWLRDVDARRVAEALPEVLREDRRCWCVAGDPSALERAGAALSDEERLTRTPEALLGLG